MELNIFELASRQKLRFETNRGPITTEQLWDLPLTSKNGFDLDSVGQTIIIELESTTTRSLVKTAPNPRATQLNLQLDIIKHVIAVKQAENAAKLQAAEKAAKREKLVAALANQEDKALANLTPEQIRAELAKLDE